MVLITLNSYFEYDSSILDIDFESDFDVEFEAVESFTSSKGTKTVTVYETMTESEIIERWNEQAKNPNPNTGLPLPWDQETNERKAQAIVRGQKPVETRTISCEIQQHFNGYYVTTDKWVRLFSPNSVSVVT